MQYAKYEKLSVHTIERKAKKSVQRGKKNLTFVPKLAK